VHGAGEFTQAAGLNNDVEWIVSEIIRSPEVEVLSADRQINASSENNMTDLNRYYKIGQGIYFFLDFGPLIWAGNGAQRRPLHAVVSLPPEHLVVLHQDIAYLASRLSRATPRQPFSRLYLPYPICRSDRP